MRTESPEINCKEIEISVTKKHFFTCSGLKVTVLLFVNMHHLMVSALTAPKDKAEH